MQMVKRIVGGFVLSLLLLWLFAPKQELYYLLERSLKKNRVVISNETFKDTWFGFTIKNANIYFDGAKVAQVESLNFNFFFIYSNLTITNAKVDKSLQSMAPKSIQQLKATYSILNPLKITIKGEGSFGTLDGEVLLTERKIEILFPAPKELQNIKKFLKKDNTKGWYYEKTY